MLPSGATSTNGLRHRHRCGRRHRLVTASPSLSPSPPQSPSACLNVTGVWQSSAVGIDRRVARSVSLRSQLDSATGNYVARTSVDRRPSSGSATETRPSLFRFLSSPSAVYRGKRRCTVRACVCMCVRIACEGITRKTGYAERGRRSPAGHGWCSLILPGARQNEVN